MFWDYYEDAICDLISKSLWSFLSHQIHIKGLVPPQLGLSDYY